MSAFAGSLSRYDFAQPIRNQRVGILSQATPNDVGVRVPINDAKNASVINGNGGIHTA